jgi:hypothetical protein
MSKSAWFLRPENSRMLCLLSVVGMGGGSPVQAQTPRTVVVRGLDYAFQAPDTVPAGLTLFVLENQGTVRHELVLVRLKQGHTLAEVIAAKTPPERLALYDGIVGLIVAEPGARAMGTLTTDLTQGRTYVLTCNLRDAPDKQLHLAQGMAHVLQVR